MAVSMGDVFMTVIGLTVLITNITAVAAHGLTDLMLECWPITDSQLDTEICITMPSTKIANRQTIKLPSRQARQVNQLKERRQGGFITFLHSSTALQSKAAKAMQVAKGFWQNFQKHSALQQEFTASLLAFMICLTYMKTTWI